MICSGLEGCRNIGMGYDEDDDEDDDDDGAGNQIGSWSVLLWCLWGWAVQRPLAA